MKIVSDTSTLYSPAQGKELDVEILPLNVSAGDNNYLEFVDVSSNDFLQEVKKGAMPISSQPSIGHTVEVFEKYNNEDILVISMADGLSGTYQGMLSAKESVVNKDKIHVINSKTLCGPHRYLLQKAVSLKQKGATIEEMIKKLQESIETEVSFLIPQDFGFLKRGGRLTPMAAGIGGLLKIIPVMKKTDDGKRIEKYAVKKTMRGVTKGVIEYFKEKGVNEDYIIFISHAGVLEQANAMKAQMQEMFEQTKIKLYELSPAFITQGGPGCIAIQVIKK